MKCVRCRAANPRDAVNCWACGVRLLRRGTARNRAAFRPEAMRHYSSTSVAIEQHRFWLDGLVLISTVLFGLLLGYFLVDALPGTRAEFRRPISFSLKNPLAIFSPAPVVLDAVPFGQAQAVRGVVSQAVNSRRTRGEGGRQAAGGKEFLATIVVIDNQSKESLTYELSDWQVRDSKGRIIPVESIRGAGWLSSGTVGAGQTVQGTIAFLVPEGDAKLQLSFAPAALRSVLRWDVPPPAE